MSGEHIHHDDEVQAAWRSFLTTGKPPDSMPHPWYESKLLRPLYRLLPAEPRCRICYYPFEGVGGAVMRTVFGITPSKLNPLLCNKCEQFAHRFGGGAEVEITLLFADVRGSTGLAEKMTPTEFGGLMNRFYRAATKVLYDSGALVEKVVGDAVTGFYTPGYSGSGHARQAIEAARGILKATGHGGKKEPWIPVGIGVHTGVAYVGVVGADAGAEDIAVFGDAANIGARLAALAGPGEILASREAAAAAGLEAAGREVRRLELKGREEPVEAWLV